jgi:serine/threonine-protein kinase
MYTLLTGVPVREAPTPNLALLAAMTEPVRPVREIASWLPAEVALVVDKGLALERDARFPDARAMQLAVRRARERLASGGGTVLLVPDAVTPPVNAPMRSGFEPQPSRARSQIALAAVAVVALAGLAYGAASRTDGPRAAISADVSSAAFGAPPAPDASAMVAMPKSDAPATSVEPVPRASAEEPAARSSEKHGARPRRAPTLAASGSPPAAPPASPPATPGTSSSKPVVADPSPLDMRR